MIYIIVIVFALMAWAYYGNPAGDDLRHRADEARILAQQMIYYHSAAAKACASVCPDGPIDPSTFLSTARAGRGVFANGSLKSFAFGDYVYTYYLHAGPTDQRKEVGPRVAAAAIDEIVQRDTQAWIGSFDAASGHLAARGNSVWIDPQTGEASTASPPDVDLTGSGIPDGVPVIVNRM